MTVPYEPYENERPPTAAEVAAHAEAGGRVEQWSWATQRWHPVDESLPIFADLEPQVPQPGLRLLPITEETS